MLARLARQRNMSDRRVTSSTVAEHTYYLRGLICLKRLQIRERLSYPYKVVLVVLHELDYIERTVCAQIAPPLL